MQFSLKICIKYLKQKQAQRNAKKKQEIKTNKNLIRKKNTKKHFKRNSKL